MEKITLDSLFVGKKWSDAYDCGSGAELNCIILITERAIKENWDLLKLRDFLQERIKRRRIIELIK